MLSFQLTSQGIDPALPQKAQRAMLAGIKDAMTKAAAPLKDAGRAAIAGRLNIKKKSALNAWKPRVLPEVDPAHPTALVAKLKFDWMVIHQTGGDIKPGTYMFIPKGNVRIPKKKLKAELQARRMMVVKKASWLLVYKVSFTKSGKRRPDVLVGVLVPSVRIKKRLDMDGTLQAFRPQLDQLLTDAVTQRLATL